MENKEKKVEEKVIKKSGILKKFLIVFILLILSFIFYINNTKYIFNEEKSKKLVNPILFSISKYIKLNHKFPTNLNNIQDFPYKNLKKFHNEGTCDSCYSYPLKNNFHKGFTVIDTWNEDKDEFNIQIIFKEVKIGVNYCMYSFYLNGNYTGKCYEASGFGINR